MSAAITPRVVGKEDFPSLSSLPEVSIIVPAYNEARRLPSTLAALSSYLKQARFPAEVIVVDDGSTDSTARIATGWASEFAQLRVLLNGRNYGKGCSVRQGVLQSQGRFILFTDADLSTPIQEADRFLALLEQGCDVVLGSREINPDLLVGPQPWVRRRAGQLFRWLVALAVDLPFRDTQCGFKAFRRAAALRLFQLQRVDGFGFDVEILWLAQRLGYQCREVGVLWKNDPETHVSMVRDGPRMLWEVLQMRWRGRTRSYEQEYFPASVRE